MIRKQALFGIVLSGLTVTPAMARGPDGFAPRDPIPLHRSVQQERGVFAGVSLRMVLGGEPSYPRLSAGFAPQVRGEVLNGPVENRIGEGFALTFAGEGPPQLNLGGRSLRDAATIPGFDGERRNLSTGTAAAIVGGVVLLGVGAFILVRAEQLRNEDE